MLAKLIDDKIAFTPRPADRTYEFNGRANFGRILGGIVEVEKVTEGMVPVRGFAKGCSIRFSGITATAAARVQREVEELTQRDAERGS